MKPNYRLEMVYGVLDNQEIDKHKIINVNVVETDDVSCDLIDESGSAATKVFDTMYGLYYAIADIVKTATEDELMNYGKLSPTAVHDLMDYKKFIYDHHPELLT